jgi:diguanylate cyclase (GGDEF)-like protein/PAS domain S-box-containing protein
MLRCPDRSPDEPARLRALAEYGIDPERGLPSLDSIVDMAVRLFDCPAAAVNMIGDDHVFLASSSGIGECDLSRDVSFCAHAINQDDVMVVEDATLDPRFHDNPIVAAGMIRFYAGVALRAPSGHALGALCLLDDKPRAGFSIQDRARLLELAGLVSDKLELRRLDAVAAIHPSRFEASAATSPNAVICFDERARISTCNAAACAMFDRPAEGMIGQSIDLLIAEQDRGLAHAGIARVLGGGTPVAVGTALTGLRSDGRNFPAELHWSRWHEDDRMHFGAIVQDMTEKLREHDALYRLANYDTLTGLPNRNLLHRHLSDAMALGGPVAVIFTKLDGFTDINNTLGHAAGDRVLVLVSERIRSTLPGSGMVARISGGEFAMLLHACDVMTIAEIARRINALVAEPIVVDGHEVRIAANCGMAIAPNHGDTADALMGSAELALFHARSAGRGEIFLFIPNLRAEAVARRMYDAELHRAFEREEFVLFYQPQVALPGGAVTGAEALIRWKHPERGLLAPAAFLPALEAGVLSGPVGRWVLETACARAALWRNRHPDFRISINLSAAQFRDGDLPGLVADTLDRHHLPPEALELEITENIILDQEPYVLAQLEEIRRLGPTLSFDDFGTGFASLNLLRTFPVTQIKIDKSFTQVMLASARDRVIVVGMIDMARRLDLEVVAEGIEDAADADFLHAHGCEKGQGFLYGKPVPAALFEERFLAANTLFLRA